MGNASIFCEFMMKMDASGDVHMHMAHSGLSSDMSVTKDLSSVAYEDAECDNMPPQRCYLPCTRRA